MQGHQFRRFWHYWQFCNSSLLIHLLFRRSFPYNRKPWLLRLLLPRCAEAVCAAVLKIVSLLVALAVFTVAGITLWFYRTARGSLAQLDGEISIVGLKAPVQVIRDTHGVPHLNATSNEDLFFAQGYVTAQDRLWQMDMTRRAMAGELAEILPAASAPPSLASRLKGTPPSWVDYDKQQRILRLRAVAERVAAQLSDRDQSLFYRLCRRRKCLHRTAPQKAAN